MFENAFQTSLEKKFKKRRKGQTSSWTNSLAFGTLVCTARPARGFSSPCADAPATSQPATATWWPYTSSGGRCQSLRQGLNPVGGKTRPPTPSSLHSVSSIHSLSLPPAQQPSEFALLPQRHHRQAFGARRRQHPPPKLGAEHTQSLPSTLQSLSACSTMMVSPLVGARHGRSLAGALACLWLRREPYPTPASSPFSCVFDLLDAEDAPVRLRAS
jgi:hypothetical protein